MAAADFADEVGQQLSAKFGVGDFGVELNSVNWPGVVLDGGIPPKQLKMVLAWIEIHQEALMADWDLAVRGEEPFRIAPLQ